MCRPRRGFAACAFPRRAQPGRVLWLGDSVSWALSLTLCCCAWPPGPRPVAVTEDYPSRPPAACAEAPPLAFLPLGGVRRGSGPAPSYPRPSGTPDFRVVGTSALITAAGRGSRLWSLGVLEPAVSRRSRGVWPCLDWAEVIAARSPSVVSESFRRGPWGPTVSPGRLSCSWGCMAVALLRADTPCLSPGSRGSDGFAESGDPFCLALPLPGLKFKFQVEVELRPGSLVARVPQTFRCHSLLDCRFKFLTVS